MVVCNTYTKEEEITCIISWAPFVYDLCSSGCLCTSVEHIRAQWSALCLFVCVNFGDTNNDHHTDSLFLLRKKWKKYSSPISCLGTADVCQGTVDSTPSVDCTACTMPSPPLQAGQARCLTFSGLVHTSQKTGFGGQNVFGSRPGPSVWKCTEINMNFVWSVTPLLTIRWPWK